MYNSTSPDKLGCDNEYKEQLEDTIKRERHHDESRWYGHNTSR